MSLSECKVMGLKSHDCHVLMQQLVPVALKGLLLKGPRHAVNRLCLYFKRLCQRVLVREVLLELETDVVDILSLLERYFPPSFFDVMIHLVIHLVREARICGPVQFHWMYPSERMHMNELMVSDRRLIKDSSLLWKIHSEQFPSWLKAKIELDSFSTNYFDLLKWLANGPRKIAMSYTGYIINGQRFHIKSMERSTQNSGVSIDATTLCRSSAKDRAQVVNIVAYYGVLQEVILLDYYVHQLPIFKCD
ncbi:uncharacterized protein LOC111023579 isoform X2 [Momordica charantia]|uniref:Uncharacterized protein LOC111023579 isoform X2 n=1 Tax=Momordica charantia TaxID=3673 RepID=A0A6J1DUG4_MOMCH|nr:uncharacterized protein LOC111023579 isoform X2 [Momordica charantia]